MRSQNYFQKESRRYKDLGVDFLAKRKYEKAIDNFIKAYEKSPKDLWILHKIADCHLGMGKVESAVRVLETLSNHYEKNGYFKKALAVLRRANNLYPSGETLIAIDRVQDALDAPVILGKSIPSRSPEMPLYGLEIDIDL